MLLIYDYYYLLPYLAYGSSEYRTLPQNWTTDYLFTYDSKAILGYTVIPHLKNHTHQFSPISEIKKSLLLNTSSMLYPPSVDWSICIWRAAQIARPSV